MDGCAYGRDLLMASLWFKDGKLVFSGGKLTFCGSCPCGAPSSCPCTTWPNPATSGDFPCGGLQYQYRVSSPNNFQEIYYVSAEDCTGPNSVVSQWSSTAPYTVSALGGLTCHWDTYMGGDAVTLSLSGGVWTLEFSQGYWYFWDKVIYTKSVGATPVGVYTLTFQGPCFAGGLGGSYKVTGAAATVEVTDVP